MSFSFTALGSKNDVIRQLRDTDPTGADGFNKAGREIALLIARHLEESNPSTSAGYTYSYVVKASGHSSKTGTPLSLNVMVEPLWIPVPPETEPALDEPALD